MIKSFGNTKNNLIYLYKLSYNETMFVKVEIRYKGWREFNFKLMGKKRLENVRNVHNYQVSAPLVFKNPNSFGKLLFVILQYTVYTINSCF